MESVSEERRSGDLIQRKVLMIPHQEIQLSQQLMDVREDESDEVMLVLKSLTAVGVKELWKISFIQLFFVTESLMNLFTPVNMKMKKKTS